jgi:murein DD-endopeptidase MepM/ murein hydrolase activator NlpD
MPPVLERPEPRLPHHEVGPIVPPLVETEPALAPIAAPAPAPAPRSAAGSDESGWSGSYTVARGDSLYAIARKHGIRLNDLERENNISNPRKVMPGTVLKVPRPGEAQRAAAARPARVARAPVVPAAAKPVPTTSLSSGPPSVEPTIINSRTRVAALGKDAANPSGTAADVSPIAPAASNGAPLRDAAASASKSAAPTTKFRWPARGKIITNFGPQADGRNEGINISLPRGADVYAAEGGVVTYAGDGVKGYGNLLLIRHDGGWITAYAHNDSLAVKSGESVRRGQVIAKAGATGSVDHPQLHFEIRQGTKPVDPVKHLEN